MVILRRWTAGLALALLACGCEPALNWRNVPAGDAVVQLPCRPKGQRRDLPLAGRTVSVQLQTCEASGVTWAVLDVRAPDGDAHSLVGALHHALAGNLAATDAAAGTRPPVEAAASEGEGRTGAGGSAASAAEPGVGLLSGRRQLQGRREDGSPAIADVSYGQRAGQAVQLVALMAQAPDAALGRGLEHFHASLSWTRP